MNRGRLSSIFKPLRQTKCPIQTIQIIQTPSQAFSVSAHSNPQPTTGRTQYPPKHDQADVSIQRQERLQWRNAVYEPILPVDNTPGSSSNARPYPSSIAPSSGHPLHSGLPKLATQVARPHEPTTSPSSPLPSHQLEPKVFDTNTIHGSSTGHSASLSAPSQTHGNSSEPKSDSVDTRDIYGPENTTMSHDSQPKRSRAAVAASLGLNEEELDDVSGPAFSDIVEIFGKHAIISVIHGRKDDLNPDDHA
ncbi:hypothetical protein V565_067030 [Rhizoctonia solani 123E]|uniref:Uncharacterized protein n=1 Tax=Rhizoctonia solani 123E TaxID=1423351 RepID=A0A074RW20_9AGAM|nr:hypothetical protein V565_067030 [Rhizoctonia solani 123E]